MYIKTEIITRCFLLGKIIMKVVFKLKSLLLFIRREERERRMQIERAVMQRLVSTDGKAPEWTEEQMARLLVDDFATLGDMVDIPAAGPRPPH